MTLQVIRGSDLMRAYDLLDEMREFRARVAAEISQDPEELPDDQIVPDNADPLPPDPEIKTDPVDDE